MRRPRFINVTAALVALGLSMGNVPYTAPAYADQVSQIGTSIENVTPDEANYQQRVTFSATVLASYFSNSKGFFTDPLAGAFIDFTLVQGLNTLPLCSNVPTDDNGVARCTQELSAPVGEYDLYVSFGSDPNAILPGFPDFGAGPQTPANVPFTVDPSINTSTGNPGTHGVGGGGGATDGTPACHPSFGSRGALVGKNVAK